MTAGIVYALIAVALSPLANWVLGEADGYRTDSTSSPWYRRAIGLAYFAAIGAAIWSVVA